MNFRYFFICLLISSPLLGNEATTCSPQSYNELITCSLKNSSEALQLQTDGESRVQKAAQAQQWLNPDLDAEYISRGTDKSELSAQLMFNLSLNGKGTAEVEHSKTLSQYEQAELDNSQMHYRLKLMLSLHRLAQLQNEISIVTEARQTFTKIIHTYNSKQIASPEVQISVSIFKMALGSQQFLLTKLQNEEAELLQSLKISLNLDDAKILELLPTEILSWPSVAKNYDVSLSPEIHRADLELTLSQKNLDFEQASSWPDLKIGPSIKVQRDPTQTENWAGLSLSLPLPLFSINQTGRRAAQLAVQAAEINLNLVKQKTLAEHTRLVLRYQNLVQTLQEAPSTVALEQQHSKLESLFFKGLVSSSLVIEAHRQLYDLEASRHELQLDALKNYGEILISERRFEGVVL